MFTSSGSGLFGQPNSPGYVAAKMGVVGLMNSLALEGREHNVLANTIGPVAYTRLTAKAFGPAAERRTRAELVSALVTYLASERCDVTRQIIEVGAGNYARVFIGRARGIDLDVTSGAVEPETIEGRIDEILDTTDHTIPTSTMEVLARMFGSAT